MRKAEKKHPRTPVPTQKRPPLRERFSGVASRNGEVNKRQEQIIKASLEVLKEKGLGDLSLRDIAKRINIQAPALYWHFKNKEMLVDYMAEAILQKEFTNLKPRSGKETWQKWLIKTMSQLRTAMLAYPDGARVVAGAHLNAAVTLVQMIEFALQSLTTAGVLQQKAFHIFITALHYTFGSAIEEQSGPTPDEEKRFNPKVFFASYPYFAKAVNEGRKKGRARDEDFLIGLDFIIKGAER